MICLKEILENDVEFSAALQIKKSYREFITPIGLEDSVDSIERFAIQVTWAGAKTYMGKTELEILLILSGRLPYLPHEYN